MPFASTKQENYLRMHHPSIYNKWKKEGFKKGGKIEYEDKMPHGMYQESKMVTIPWDKPKRELMKKESLLLPMGNYSMTKKITKDVKLPKHKKKEKIELLEKYRGGKIEDYKKGGKVACYAEGGYNTDTVPAMLTPGEVVLNQDQQEKLGNMMAGGGKAGGGQARAAALFKHIGVPGYKEGIKLPDSQPQLLPGKTKEEYAQAFKLDPSTVSVDTLGHTPTSYDFRIKGTGLGGKEQSYRDRGRGENLTIGAGQEHLIAPDWRAQVDSLKSTGKMSDLRKGMALFHEKTKGMTPEEIIEQQYTKTRKAGGGLVDKKDALMAYYMGGKVKKKKKKRGY